MSEGTFVLAMAAVSGAVCFVAGYLCGVGAEIRRQIRALKGGEP